MALGLSVPSSDVSRGSEADAINPGPPLFRRSHWGCWKAAKTPPKKEENGEERKSASTELRWEPLASAPNHSDLKQSGFISSIPGPECQRHRCWKALGMFAWFS